MMKDDNDDDVMLDYICICLIVKKVLLLKIWLSDEIRKIQNILDELLYFSSSYDL